MTVGAVLLVAIQVASFVLQLLMVGPDFPRIKEFYSTLFVGNHGRRRDTRVRDIGVLLEEGHLWNRDVATPSHDLARRCSICKKTGDRKLGESVLRHSAMVHLQDCKHALKRRGYSED